MTSHAEAAAKRQDMAERYGRGGVTMRELAKQYGVSYQRVSQQIRRFEKARRQRMLNAIERLRITVNLLP